MGMRFRKTVDMGNGMKMTISPSGVSYSMGQSKDGINMRVTKLANGKTRTTTTIKGTGLSYVQETPKKKK
jgi:hypothetical protein